MKIKVITTFLLFCLIAGICFYKYWGIDETIRKIETEHNKINGTPTTLEINLYYSAWLIRYGEKPFKTVVFEYD